MSLKCFGYILCLLQAVSGNTNSAPRSMKFPSPFKNTKIVVGAGALLAGYFGKQVYDGPEFKENVDLSGKTIVITGANTGLGKEAAL